VFVISVLDSDAGRDFSSRFVNSKEAGIGDAFPIAIENT